MKQQKNQFSHLTAIERSYLSFPAQFLLNQNLLQGKILDFGCGFGNDVKILRQKGCDITGYDPYYFPKYPDTKFDTGAMRFCEVLKIRVLNHLFRAALAAK